MRYFIDLAGRYVPRGSVVLGITTLGSYVVGLLRDRIFAQTFGASVELDAYNAGFLIPDFVFNLLVASGIAAAAVPLFIRLNKQSKQEAFEYMNALIVMATAAMAVAAVGIFFGAPLLSWLVAPGLSGEGQALVVKLMRVVAIAPLFFAVSNAMGAMLVAQSRFFFYGLSPIFYNAGIIFGTLYLVPQFGIIGVAWGTVIGAGLHAVLRVVDGLASGWRFGFRLSMPVGMGRRTLQLMAPKMVGHPVEMVTFWVFVSLASLLTPGSITVLNFARNFQSVPVSLLGITMATAAFPLLSQAALGGGKNIRGTFLRVFTTIFLASVLAAIVTFLIRYPLVNMLLGGGAFDEAAVTTTALVLGVFTLAIPTESMNHLLARSFYAMENTVLPVVFSVISLLVASISAYVLIGKMGIVGLPLGFFLGSVTKTIGLLIAFWGRIR